jgi:3-oxoacyl-[acyl-carrier protein] reductase
VIDPITRELALELADKGIRVNAIAPAMTETESAKALGFSLPMGRIGRPEDIAQVALFLASDQSAWVTGERIAVSGGQRLDESRCRHRGLGWPVTVRCHAANQPP